MTRQKLSYEDCRTDWWEFYLSWIETSVFFFGRVSVWVIARKKRKRDGERQGVRYFLVMMWLPQCFKLVCIARLYVTVYIRIPRGTICIYIRVIYPARSRSGGEKLSSFLWPVLRPVLSLKRNFGWMMFKRLWSTHPFILLFLIKSRLG